MEDSSAMASAATSKPNYKADVRTATIDTVSKPYYAISSSHALVVLDDTICVKSLFVGGWLRAKR